MEIALSSPFPRYRAATIGIVSVAANTDPFLLLEGSPTRLAVIQKIFVTRLSTTAAAYVELICQKHSTAANQGSATPVTLVQTPLDSKSPLGSLSTCRTFTVNPTAGTLVGTIGSRGVRTALTGTPSGNAPLDQVVFDFTGGQPDGGAPLRGIAQGLSLSFAAIPSSVVALQLEVEWFEIRAVDHIGN